MRAAPRRRMVLWDADGVLQRSPGAEESIRESVEGLVGDVDAFVLAAVAAERPALCGQVRWADVLPGLLARWGAPDAVDHVMAAWLTIEPVPQARAVVHELRRAGVRCYLATNQDQQRAQHMREQLDYEDLLDGAFYSHALGVAKPDPHYFRAVLADLGATPQDVVLIDDNRANVDSARSLGMAAEVWSCREAVDVLWHHLARLDVLTPGAGSRG